MTKPRLPQLNAVPDVVIGRAIQDPVFRYALLGAKTAEAIRSSVWDELEVQLSDKAVQQIQNLDTGQVDQALAAVKDGAPSAQ